MEPQSDAPSTDRATRLACAGLLALVAPLGLASKLYAGPGATWVVGYAGGFLYVLFWILLALLVAPGASPRAVSACVLAATSLLEALQLWHPPALEGVRSSFLGHALLGSTFAWGDFVAYGLAAVAAPALVRRSRTMVSRRLDRPRPRPAPRR